LAIDKKRELRFIGGTPEKAEKTKPKKTMQIKLNEGPIGALVEAIKEMESRGYPKAWDKASAVQAALRRQGFRIVRIPAKRQK